MSKEITKTIELDCRPGYPRPGDLIGDVIAGLKLPVREAVSKIFGNWTWEFNDISDERWKEIQPTLKRRIRDLYHAGVIRYGSW